MTIQIGDRIPDSTLMTMTDGKPAPLTTAELFGGKKVVLFSVPGAFTPTCSVKHLPSFVDNVDEILADGNGEFAKSLGLEMDASGFGMGERSQRFALIADDGVVTNLFIEAPGEYRVSAAEHVLLSL